MIWQYRAECAQFAVKKNFFQKAKKKSDKQKKKHRIFAVNKNSIMLLLLMIAFGMGWVVPQNIKCESLTHAQCMTIDNNFSQSNFAQNQQQIIIYQQSGKWINISSHTHKTYTHRTQTCFHACFQLTMCVTMSVVLSEWSKSYSEGTTQNKDNKIINKREKERNKTATTKKLLWIQQQLA